jgi:dienelactone hydrolase
MKLYLAGPMSQKPFFNYPAFHAAEAELTDVGHEVFSPARMTEFDHGADYSTRYPTGDHAAAVCDGFNFRRAMAWNLMAICNEVDAIALLPGYEQSKGTQVELAVARLLGIPSYPFEELLQ